MVRRITESYSDIKNDNVWDAYEEAASRLGYKELCLALTKAMGTDALTSNLRYIFRQHDIPFNDEEYYDDED